MMENKLVQKFAQKLLLVEADHNLDSGRITNILQVNELITSIEEKNALFEGLKRYQSSSDVKKLVNELKRILNEPMKLEIYDFVRPLIRPQHQQTYDKMAPAAAGTRLRGIKLQRRGNESFGFAVRGGYEHNIGIFVSNVEKGSQAEQRGLRLGDEIVRVNGFTIAEAIHEEVLNLIKGRDEIELKVTYIGMVPIKQNTSDPVTWQYVDKLTGNNKEVPLDDDKEKEVVKIFINLRGAPSLGCSIISGPKHFPGIFVESVRPGSLGEDYGLEPGDQILDVNGKSFLNIQHKEAIVELKSSKELNIVLRKAAGLPLLGVKPRASPQASRKQGSPRQTEEDSGEVICEILEENVKEQEDKLLWEEEQLALQKQRDEETAREDEKRRELERQRQREAAERRRQEEERLDKERVEEKQREEERLRKEEAARQREKQKVAEELARKKRLQEEEEQKRQEKLKQSALLAGRAKPSNSMKPALLGAAQPSSQISFGGSGTGGAAVEVDIRKEEDVSLDIELEGGLGSPIGGKIVVAEVYGDGAVERSGEIDKGDQILSVNGISVVAVTLSAAQELLWEVEQTCPVGDFIRMEVLKGGPRADDEVTYF